MPDVSTRDIAAIVILYHPGQDAIDNTGAISGQVERVFAVDNTEEFDPCVSDMLGAFPNVMYVPMGGNTGIATALNTGIDLAREGGHSWVVTLDQDSAVPAGLVATLLECLRSCETDRPVAIVAPVYAMEGGPAPETFAGCLETLTVITSGNLLNVEAWMAVGRFDESLFIDQVDHDLCLRLRLGGYAVLECGSALLRHRIGDLVERRLRGPVYVSNHSALRRYYITRNRFTVTRKYRTQFPGFRASEMRALLHELLKVLLFEDDRFAKLWMSWRGYLDYRRGVTGPYPGGPDRNGA